MTETPQQAYISKVHLKGYKSIRDLEIDFKPGLNIIIGPNGSGKTNFLQFTYFLNQSPDSKKELYTDRNNMINAEIYFSSLPFYPFTQLKHYKKIITSENTLLRKTNPPKSVFRIIDDYIDLENNQKIASVICDISNNEIINTEYLNKDFNDFFLVSDSFKIRSLRFNNVLYESLKKKITVHIGEVDFVDESEIYHIYQDCRITSHSNLEIAFLDDVMNECFEDYSSEYKSIPSIDELIKNLNFSDSFLKAIFNYSPISKVEFVKEHIIPTEILAAATLDNIFLKFQINNSWFNWSDLSDGTQRMFYLIGSTFYAKNNEIVFIEEPELGIHPDQLHKLMDFLIEQSKEKQIIITTHSPEVLNAIHPDELDRIIVTRYDADKGTIMHKLTPEQAKEMGKRVKEGDMFLSDRWVHLNLEDEIFNATKLNEK